MNSTTATPPTTMSNNNTTISEEERKEYLEGLNWGLMNELTPFLSIIILLLVAGLIGNCVIIAVYYKRYPSSMTRICVLTMGVADLTTIIIVIPVEIMRVRWYFAYGPPACVCRLIWGVLSTLIIFSGTILVIVAFVRKRVVLRRAAREPKSSLKKIKIILAIALGLSFLVSIPRFVIMGNKTLTFPGTDITGFSCGVEDQYETSKSYKAYNIILALYFIFMCVIMNVCYGQIACFLWQHKKKRRQEKRRSGTGDKLRPKSEQDEKAETSFNNIDNIQPESGPAVDYSSDSALDTEDESNMEDESHTVDTSTQMSELTSGAGEAVVSSSPAGQETPYKRPKSQASRRRSHRRSKRGPQGKKIPTRTTLMLFVLSVVFVVNYVPFHMMHMLQQLTPHLTEGIEKNVFFLLISTQYLNSAANPFVYSFCSAMFRYECRNLFGLKH